MKRKFIILLPVFLLLFISCTIAICFNKTENKVVAKYIKTGNYAHTIEYNGTIYYPVSTSNDSLCRYGTGKNLGRVNNVWGDNIYSLLYDDNLEFLYVPQFRDGQMYSKSGKGIQQGTNITAIYLGAYAEHRVSDAKDIKLLLSLKDVSGESYSYKLLSSGRFAESLYIAYDNSAIATSSLGYIAHTENKWIYVPENGITEDICSGIVIQDKNIISEIIRITRDVDCLN